MINFSKKVAIAVIVVVLTAVFVLFWPYIKVEYLTMKYGDEFVGLEEQTNMLHDSRYLKVFGYDENEAVIFYVSDSGDMVTFVKDENGSWSVKTWKTIWSTTGSADEFIWPYYR